MSFWGDTPFHKGGREVFSNSFSILHKDKNRQQSKAKHAKHVRCVVIVFEKRRVFSKSLSILDAK